MIKDFRKAITVNFKKLKMVILVFLTFCNIVISNSEKLTHPNK